MQQKHKKIYQGYKELKRVDLDFIPSDLCVCSNELWVGARDKGILVFNFNLEQINHIKGHQLQLQDVISLVTTPTGVIVCDRDTGVHHLNHQGDYTNLICSGNFSDAYLASIDSLYALQY